MKLFGLVTSTILIPAQLSLPGAVAGGYCRLADGSLYVTCTTHMPKAWPWLTYTHGMRGREVHCICAAPARELTRGYLHG